MWVGLQSLNEHKKLFEMSTHGKIHSIKFRIPTDSNKILLVATQHFLKKLKRRYCIAIGNEKIWKKKKLSKPFSVHLKQFEKND